MSSETTSTSIRRTSNIFILAGILILWVIGLVNLFDQQIIQGLGMIVASFIFLRLFVWLEKLKLRKSH